MAQDSLKVIADGTALDREPGGARVRFVSLYAAAAEREGLELTVLLRPDSGLEDAFPAGSAVRVAFARPAPALGRRTAPAARHFGFLHPAVRFLREEGAGVFAAETLPLPRVRGVPMAATLHDVRYLRPGLASLPRRAYAALLLRRNLERAAAVIAVSHATADEIAAHGLCGRKKIFVVPNAAPPAAGVAGDRAREILEELGVRRPYALCLGRLERRKNVPALLDAFEEFSGGAGKDFQLVLAGSFAGAGGRAVLRRVRSSPRLGGRVVATGVVNEEAKAALLENAFLLALPSLYEGFSLGLLEAMTAGVSVACSSIPAHWETAGKAALFFDPCDPGEMARALTRLVKEDALRQDLCAQGKRQTARFSWERSAVLLEDVYRSIL